MNVYIKSIKWRDCFNIGYDEEEYVEMIGACSCATKMDEY